MKVIVYASGVRATNGASFRSALSGYSPKRASMSSSVISEKGLA